MNYLIYIEHAAENLQFFLWYRDFVKRFFDLPPNERALAPEWSVEQTEAELQSAQALQTAKQQISPETAEVFKGTDFAAPRANIMEVKSNPFNTPPRTPAGDRESTAPTEAAWSDHGSTLNGSVAGSKTHHKQAAGAFEGADLKWQPCKSQHNLSPSITEG